MPVSAESVRNRKAAWLRNWRLKNPQKAKEKARLYYLKNREHDKIRSTAYRISHKELYRAAAKKYRERYKERCVNSSLRSRFNISLEHYEQLLAKQDGVCAICKQQETFVARGTLAKLCVDHNHNCCSGKKSCGKCVRGLLCHRCNLVLGHLKDDPDLLRNAASYIERYI